MRSHGLGVTAVWCLVAASAANAQSSVSVDLAAYTLGEPAYNQVFSVTDPISAAQQVSMLSAQTGNHAHAFGAASFGHLRATASGYQYSETGGYYRGTLGSANVGFSETSTLTPSNPALLGTAGTITATMLINGTGVGGLTGQDSNGDGPYFSHNNEAYFTGASWSVSGTGSAQGGGGDGTVFAGGLGPQGESRTWIGAPVTITIPFVFGQAFEWGVAFSVTGGYSDAYIANFDVAWGTADFGNSATWGGISTVSVNGGPVLGTGDYTLASASGTDYRDAIPAPGTAAIAGLVGLFATGRRRR